MGSGSINSLWIPVLAASTVLCVGIFLYAWENMTGLVSNIVNPKKEKSALEGVGDDNDLPALKQSSRKKRSKKMKEAVIIEFDRNILFPVELSWEDVSCTVSTGDAKGIKVVLQKSRGTFLPSEFVAIVGPSGAGKSTMLDVLACRKTGKGVDGIITLNGHRITRELANRCISYVGQEDVFMPNLSVWESLLFVSQLCMEPIPRAERAARMDSLLDQMGLLKVKHSKVGGALPGGLAVRGLSGGEKRRLSIACGLVGNPSVLFLDEPTTGLDSLAALAVMTYLSSLAGLGHTIVSTIHQPRQEIFNAFDKILVMSEGYQLYLAPPSYVTRWFVEVLGYPYSKKRDGTESDWLLSTVAVGFEKSAEEKSRTMSTLDEVQAASERFSNFVGHLRGTSDQGSSYAGSEVSGTSYQDSYHDSNTTSRPSYMPRKESSGSVFSGYSLGSKALMNGHTIQPIAGEEVEYAGDDGTLGVALGSLYARSWFVQFAILFKRSFLYLVRNPAVAANRLMGAILGGTVVGLCWIRIPDDPSSAQQRLSLLFWAIMMFCMIPFGWAAFPSSEKRFFTLDSAKDLYYPSAYFAGYTIANLPSMIMCGYSTIWIVYGLAGLRPDAWAMFQTGAILTLQSVIANQLVTACVWLFNGQDTAAAMGGLYISFSLLICGYYIRVSDMTLSIARGLSWASFNKYAFQAVAVTELGRNRQWTQACPVQTGSAAAGFAGGGVNPLCQITSEQLLDYYDYKLSIGQSCGALLGFWGFFLLVSYWGLLRLYAKR